MSVDRTDEVLFHLSLLQRFGVKNVRIVSDKPETTVEWIDEQGSRKRMLQPWLCFEHDAFPDAHIRMAIPMQIAALDIPGSNGILAKRIFAEPCWDTKQIEYAIASWHSRVITSESAIQEAYRRSKEIGR